jgi:nicotinic acid phosphoribosyltransferase
LHKYIFFCRYKASGIRLDSGDLAYLSIEARKVFHALENNFNVPGFGEMIITASNDLNEETIDALNKQVTKLPHILTMCLCFVNIILFFSLPVFVGYIDAFP